MFQRHIKYFGHLVFFWMVYFAVDRLLFLIYNLSISSLTLMQIFEPFWHALRLDLSAVCYMISPLFFIWLVSLFIPIRKLENIIKAYFWIIIPIVTFGVVANLEVYHEWGYNINRDAVSYLKYPKEFWASSLNAPLGLLSVIYTIYALLFIGWGLRIAKRNSNFSSHASGLSIKRIIKNSSAAILSFILFGICLRGGIQLAPINQSFAVYSENKKLNAASVNTIWNLLYSYSRVVHDNPYQFFANSEIQEILSKNNDNNNKQFPKIFSGNNLNIVLVVLEGVASEMFKNMGSKSQFTTHMDHLIENGILFDNIYATEKRTDRGLVSILSGYPSLPLISLVKQPDKAATLPFLPNRFKNVGYETVFIYGGESEFANIKSFLLNAGFNHIIDKNNFQKKDIKSKWGAHDHIVFNRTLDELNKLVEPFFITILTLSSHEPFEIPMEPILNGNDRQTLYKNSIIYTDRSVYNFMNSVAKKPFYDNTIFVFISDHGFRVGDAINWYPRRHRIPLFIYGKPLREEWRGKRISEIGSQADLAKTILYQFNLNANGFDFSRNLLDNTISSAFYTFNHGFGWIEKEQMLVYDHDIKSVTFLNGYVPDSINQVLFNRGKAYLQKSYQDFIDRK
ncbi:MAG: sulfatase-like hydrolase/transferase [Candidatus Marinimicrobia bacterium]|nr:sulfatase-like hydrolase/transferase [Candidatus Neomarinimicrobiota bacterium]